MLINQYVDDKIKFGVIGKESHVLVINYPYKLRIEERYKNDVNIIIEFETNHNELESIENNILNKEGWLILDEDKLPPIHGYFHYFSTPTVNVNKIETIKLALYFRGNFDYIEKIKNNITKKTITEKSKEKELKRKITFI